MNLPVPTWVEADPAREISIDALGLSSQADQLADVLLPDVSVLTRRARYLSFLPWAISKTANANNQELEIHRLEAKLALWAAKPHRKDPENNYPKCCQGLIGRQLAGDYLSKNHGKKPARPENLFKNTAFRAYRSLLRSIHLIDDSSGRAVLTTEGKKVALAFGRNSHGTCACMSDISKEEISIIKNALGFDGRRSVIKAKESRRRETLTELNQHFSGDDLNLINILSFYNRKPRSVKNQIPFILHKSFVWELLSLGLNLAFVCVIKDMRIKPFAIRLKKALAGHPSVPPLSESYYFKADHEDTARTVVALLRQGCSLKPRNLGLQPEGEQLAKILLDNSPNDFLEELINRHEAIKGTEAWVGLPHIRSDKLRKLSSPKKGLPKTAELHAYRMNAFIELCWDLELWH